ncbi:RNA polymerase sigma factor FliA [uncultured Campylobacter sp.]|jgi:RNA polymerase sigma factor, fliA/whiG family|uniref:RNA polymerase sigma factor FliA n=1 Tax=Campylobacter sp. TaxID=205 RepID=UPI000F128A8A|nr:RNA polymerase sigma factor FliA [uncultured Campylobacter sp.]MBF0984040.1 RNA polymerase sigma factor FliA [Campylobacter sp.]RKV96689.1 MAG: RNA polymerase sigma factor FliA [Campylobacter sp.]
MQKQPNPYAQTIKKEQDDIVLAYTPALRAMAFRLKERLPAHIDVSDLMGAGLEEMVRLSRKYDKERNDSFWGYAQKRVYGAMLDFLRGLDVVSRADRTLVKNIDALVNEYFNKFEREPEDEYLAAMLEESVEKIREARNVSAVVGVLSIDDQMELMSEENTFERVEREDLIEKITQILNEFEERDQLIVQLYYYEELSLKEIGEILQISEGRISQIHKRLMEKIRKKLEGK